MRAVIAVRCCQLAAPGASQTFPQEAIPIHLRSAFTRPVFRGKGPSRLILCTCAVGSW